MIFFYWLISVLPLEEHWFWRYQLVGTFTVIKLLGFICLLAALARIVVSRTNPHLLRSAPARWYWALVAVQCGSYFVHLNTTPVDLSNYWHIVSICSLLVVTLTFVDSRLRLRRTLLIGVCAAGFASLYTIRGQQVGGGSGVRPSGIFDDANYYALVMGLWIPLAFLWASSRRPRWERVLCFGSFVSMLLGTTFAASRGGSLGLGAAFIFLIWHSRRRFRNLLLLVVLTIPLLLYAPSSPLQRFLHPGYGDQQAEEARLIAWRAAQRMIQAHPLIGIGLGNFERLMVQYRDPDTRIVSVAHNTYLESAAELGLPALVVHVLVFVAALIIAGGVRRRARARDNNELYTFALGLQAGIVSYLVSAFFVSSWWQQSAWLPVFLVIALSRVSKRAGAVRRPLKSAPRPESDASALHNPAEAKRGRKCCCTFTSAETGPNLHTLEI